MPYIKIDQDMLLETIYKVRSKVDIAIEGNDELLGQLDQLATLIKNAPLSENKAQYPRIRIGNR